MQKGFPIASVVTVVCSAIIVTGFLFFVAKNIQLQPKQIASNIVYRILDTVRSGMTEDVVSQVVVAPVVQDKSEVLPASPAVESVDVVPMNIDLTPIVQDTPVSELSPQISSQKGAPMFDANTVTRLFFLIQKTAEPCSMATVGYLHTYTTTLAEYRTLLEALFVAPATATTINTLAEVKGVVDRIDVVDGRAEVFLKNVGAFKDACQKKQFIEQVRRTGVQFPNIDSVILYSNGVAL
jgi:hypothetical protein